MYPDLALVLLRGRDRRRRDPARPLKLGLLGQGGSITGVAGWFNSMGLRPGLFWAYMAVLAEAGGGLLTVLGLGGPIGPGLLAADLSVVLVVAHWNQGFWAGGGKFGWEFSLPLAGAPWQSPSPGTARGRSIGCSAFPIRIGSCLPGSCS